MDAMPIDDSDYWLTQAYGEGRKDERESLSNPLSARLIYLVKMKADEDGLDIIGFAWRLQKAWLSQ